MKKIRRRDTRLRFEQWARNPSCEANTISAVLGVPMSAVAEAQGIAPTMGQSPFALAGGQGFERALFRNGAETFIADLVENEVLPSGATGLLDLRMRNVGGPMRNLDQALEATRGFLSRLAKREGKAPAVVAGATINVPGRAMLPEAILVVDVLAVRTDSEPPRLVVGEVKTYPDRGGYTDRGDLASARAQAGVYVHGLERVLEELGLTGRLVVDRFGFLVLRRAGRRRASIRPREDLRYQAERARLGLERLRGVAEHVSDCGPDEAIARVAAARVSYATACVSFCDLASNCFRTCVARGDPAVLGEDVAQFLGSVTLDRATQLLNGASPESEAERDVERRLREAGGGRRES